MNRTGIWAAVLGMTLAIPAVGGAATGLKSLQGSDYSQDHNGIKQVRACDMEADSHGVRADFNPMGTTQPHTVNVDNGANNACVSSGDVRDVRGIEVLVPNILSVTAGAAIGAFFCWAGAGLELADLTVRWLLLEFAVLLSVCLLLAWSLSHLRSRAD